MTDEERTLADATDEASADDPFAGRSREELVDGFLRLQSEFENYRRRVRRERERDRAMAGRDLVAALLPVLDALDAAVAMPARGGEDGYRRGVAQIHGQLLGILAEAGLEEVPGAGRPFDPELHEAVAAVEADGGEPGTVAAVAQKGYLYRGELLRPARVRVIRRE